MSIFDDASREQIPWWDIRNKVINEKKNRAKESKSWSSYWMDDDSYDYFYDKDENKAKVGIGTSKKLTIDVSKAARLAAVRRAVSNFVQILTNDDTIKVVFSGGEQSYTNGKFVVISAEDNPEKFDVLVGTALHEAAHCVFTWPLFDEFSKLKNVDNWQWMKRFGLNYDIAIKVHWDYEYHIKNIHTIFNFLEDRRIDMEVYTRSPGYRPYYQSMYDTHWNSKENAKALIYDEDIRKPTMDSYMFRLINLTNPATKFTLHHLKDMKKIYDIVNLNNILRFSDKHGEAIVRPFLETCVLIYNIILNNVHEYSQKQQEENDLQNNQFSLNSENLDQIGEGDINNEEKSNSDLPNLDFSDNIISELDNNIDDDEDEDEDGVGSEIEKENQSIKSDEEIEKEVSKELDSRHLGKKDPNVKELMEESLNFINGNIKKKEVSEKMNNIIQATEESDTSVSTVNIHNDIFSYIRVGKLTNSTLSLLKDIVNDDNDYSQKTQREYITEGKRLGQIIVDRIKIRHDNNETKFSRRKLGKIDRRLIHSLGVDNENVFFNKLIESYKDSIFYLTIDCSDSMLYNNKWKNSVILATGLTYAATKINNFDIVVNLRYEMTNIWSITLFDSRINSFSHFEKWMSRFRIRGGTPESVVYEIEKDFIMSLKQQNNNVYFITFTDGAPYSSSDNKESFSQNFAIKHCREILNEFRNHGIDILSYFLQSSEYEYQTRFTKSDRQVFKESYGNDGVFVSLENFSMISKSVNTLLTKSDRSL